MTNENRRANSVTEVARGDASLESAEILLAAGRLADATSRAYYGAFHFARALLLTLGQEPISHAGVERALHRDVVRPGLLDADIARQFGRLQKMRQDADYTSEYVFTVKGATDDRSARVGFHVSRLAGHTRAPGRAVGSNLRAIRMREPFMNFSRLLAGSLLLLVVCFATTTRAEGPPQASANAKEHFAAGIDHIDDPSGPKYEEACREFRAAFAESPLH